MTFAIGEKVVYPNQGVGTVENITTRALGERCEQFYMLRLVCTSMTVMVPFSNVDNIGIRKITKTTEINRILSYLKTGECYNIPDWKNRFKINCDKMQSGSLLQISEVFKGLLIIQADKPLSFREKKMLERARQMLVSEVSIARGVTEIEAVVILNKALEKSHLAVPQAA